MTRRLQPDFWSRVPNLTSLFVIALLLGLYFTPFADLDFGILIRLGELIVKTGELRPPESFSYTIHGRDVPDFEWLFEWIIWGVWTTFSYGGLKLFKVVLVGSTLLVTGLHLRAEGVRWHGIALALGVALPTLAVSWNLRPLYFTTLGLLLVSWWLRDHCTGKRPLTWWLVPVMLLWANLHPGVIIGQGLLLMAVAWEWLNRWLRLNPPLDRAGLYRLTLIGGLGFAATFISPAPVERLLAPFQPAVRHPIQRITTEMQPLYQSALNPPNGQLLAYVVAVLVLLTIVFRFRHYRLWEIGLLAGLGVLANLAIRSLQDWMLLMLSLGVPHIPPLLRQVAKQRRRPWVARLLRLDRKIKALLLSPAFRFQWRWPALALAALAVVSVIPPLSRDMPVQARARDPVAAVNWIEEHGLSAKEPWRIFASPDFGAYLVWRLGGRVRDYVDTRGFCFPPELTEDAHYLPQLTPGWEERLKRVLSKGTQYFFLETTGARAQLWEELKKRHAKALYEDDKAVLLTAEEVRKALLPSGTSD
jgi:hypothetical protein